MHARAASHPQDSIDAAKARCAPTVMTNTDYLFSGRHDRDCGDTGYLVTRRGSIIDAVVASSKGYEEFAQLQTAHLQISSLSGRSKYGLSPVQVEWITGGLQASMYLSAGAGYIAD